MLHRPAPVPYHHLNPEENYPLAVDGDSMEIDIPGNGGGKQLRTQ